MKPFLILFTAAALMVIACGEREEAEKKPNEQNQYTIINGKCIPSDGKSKCPEEPKKPQEPPKPPEMECDCSCTCNGKEAPVTLDDRETSYLGNPELECFRPPCPPQPEEPAPENSSNSSNSSSSSKSGSKSSTTSDNQNTNTNTNNVTVIVNGKEVKCEEPDDCKCSCSCKEKEGIPPQIFIPDDTGAAL